MSTTAPARPANDTTVRRRKATAQERKPGARFEVGKATEVVAPPTDAASIGQSDEQRQRLAALATEMNAEYRAITKNLGRISAANADNVEHAVRIGDRLHDAKPLVKEILGPRQWMKWTDENFDGSHSLADTYMFLADHKGEISQELAKLGIERVAAALREGKKPRVTQVVTDWAAGRGKVLHRTVRDMLPILEVVEHAIELAPEADRERLNGERDVMAGEVRAFLDRPWPVTKWSSS